VLVLNSNSASTGLTKEESMKKLRVSSGRLIAGLLVSVLSVTANAQTYTPGSRIVILAHNAYPSHGMYTDRLARALSSGRPLVIEQDLAWIDGKSLMIHGAKNVSNDDPSLESYFFPAIRPLMEKALKEGNQGDWPLVTLYLDIKNDPVEHLEAISKTLDQYDAWITTAVKPSSDKKQAPLDLKPLMILVEDKQNDIKQEFFYDRIPVGGKIRVFGSVTKPGPSPAMKLSKDEAIDYMSTLSPEQLFTNKANTYRRWVGIDWATIEKGGQAKAGEWNKAKEERLGRFVSYGHRMGYFVSFYCLDGYTEEENKGWDKEYNFGSKEAVVPRWKAAIDAKADFISTDQYEDLSNMVSNGR
jgi:hypothetical protein